MSIDGIDSKGVFRGRWKGGYSIAGAGEQEATRPTSKPCGQGVVGEKQPAFERTAQESRVLGRSGFSVGAVCVL